LVIGLVYDTADSERWFATTENHPDLVRMVSTVKAELTGSPAGPFYINEYKQVIVPGSGTDDYFLAGEYEQPLQFDFEERTLSGEAISLDGRALEPGDEWTGPRPGIPYRLAAGGSDVYYKLRLRPNVERKVSLSQVHSPDVARRFASRIRNFKGWHGGRFYINEWRAIFAPLSEGSSWIYLYLGQLEPGEPWFPKPHA